MWMDRFEMIQSKMHIFMAFLMLSFCYISFSRKKEQNKKKIFFSPNSVKKRVTDVMYIEFLFFPPLFLFFLFFFSTESTERVWRTLFDFTESTSQRLKRSEYHTLQNKIK